MAECLDNTSPDEMEEGVSDNFLYRSENNDEEIEAEFLDDTSSDNIEDDVSDKKITRMKKNDEKKS